VETIALAQSSTAATIDIVRLIYIPPSEKFDDGGAQLFGWMIDGKAQA
jgi:hypothetical protein